jgi:2-keto-4-pentenoate hydratase/2-oxohepta-3-ene-1,7-dioic acid hydratase in catechol pathway
MRPGRRFRRNQYGSLIMAFVIPEPPRPTIPVEGTHELFPVRRIFCVGRNYAEHAREMGGDPNREPPFFFTKPADALVPMGGKLSFLRAGDLLLTGTPAGVGAVAPGDILEAKCALTPALQVQYLGLEAR